MTDDAQSYNYVQIVRALFGLVFFVGGLIWIWSTLGLAFALMGLYILFTETFTFFFLGSLKDFLQTLRKMYAVSTVRPDTVDMPKFSIDIEKTSAQVLTAVGGIGVTLFSKDVTVASPVKGVAVLIILFSVVLGLMYMFISQGSITNDKVVSWSGEHILSTKSYHNKWKRHILDFQILTLIFGLTVLGNPFVYGTTGFTVQPAEFRIQVRDARDVSIKEGDLVRVGSVMAIDSSKKQMADEITSLVEKYHKKSAILRRRKLEKQALELEADAGVLSAVRDVQLRESYILSPKKGKVKLIKLGALTSTGMEVVILIEDTTN